MDSIKHITTSLRCNTIRSLLLLHGPNDINFALSFTILAGGGGGGGDGGSAVNKKLLITLVKLQQRSSHFSTCMSVALQIILPMAPYKFSYENMLAV